MTHDFIVNLYIVERWYTMSLCSVQQYLLYKKNILQTWKENE